jgi:drug/metabolite transporter (DMT)-like permease
VRAHASPARVWAALTVVYVVWGSTYLFILLAERTLPVFAMSSLRFLIAGGLLYAWSIRRGDRVADRPGWRQWLASAVIGAGLFLVGNAGVAWAEKRVNTGIASLIIAAVPLWMALFDRVACGQRLSRTAVTGLAIGFGGVGLLAWPSGPSHIDIEGAIALLLSGAAWASGSLYSRRAPLPRRQFVSAGMQMLTGGVMLAIVAAATGEWTSIHHVSTGSILALVYLITIGSWLAFTAYTWLLRTTRTSLVSTYAYVNPLVAVFLGWAVENEPISARTIVAGLVVLAAVALIVTPPKGERATEPAPVPVRGR